MRRPPAHRMPLADTTAELNLRTLARLADVSVAQVSRMMPSLVELGRVERREVPPSSQFRLVRENVGAQAIIALAGSRDIALSRIGAVSPTLPIPPVSIIVFGSFARGEAVQHSDLDVIVVRRDEVAEEDHAWATAVERWRTEARGITGNRVENLEFSHDEVRARLASDTTLWREVVRDGVTVHGLSAEELLEPAT